MEEPGFKSRWSSSQKCPHFNSNSHTAAHRTAGAALTQSLQLRKGANRILYEGKNEGLNHFRIGYDDLEIYSLTTYITSVKEAAFRMFTGNWAVF